MDAEYPLTPGSGPDLKAASEHVNLGVGRGIAVPLSQDLPEHAQLNRLLVVSRSDQPVAAVVLPSAHHRLNGLWQAVRANVLERRVVIGRCRDIP